MKTILLITILFVSTLIVNSQCIYEVCLTDDYGDGWNGNTIDVTVNGSIYGNYGNTFTSGTGPVCFDINVNMGDAISVVFNATGSWTYECHFYLYDNLGNLVGTGDEFTSILNVIANCPPPPCGPTSVTPDPQVIMNCGGGQDTINFTINGGCTGNYEYQILDGATVIQPWSTTSVYYASPPTTTTFTVEVRCDVCPGIIVSDTFLIEVIPVPTITGNTTLCAGDFTTLTATGLLGNYEWWSDQIGGTLLDTTGVYTTPPLTTTTTYWTQTTGQTSTVGTILITESGLEGFMGGSGSEDYLEISNLYSTTINTTGWVAAVSDSYSDINSVNSILWQLPSSFTACSVVWRCDDSGYPANYWGNNIFWNGTSQSWSIIIDDVGNVVDFCVWGWSAAEIASMNTTINGFNITIGPEWIGNGAILPCSGVNTSLQRIGNTDTNTEIDWVCQASTVDAVNPGLSCGWMPVSCRFPTIVTVLPELVIDSIFTNPLCYGSFDGSGGVTNVTGTGPYTYLWSNTDTTQNIIGLNAGIYTVTVTDDMGCTGSASITLTDPPAISAISSSTGEICGQSNGTISVTGSGGTGTLEYDYGSGSNTTGNFTGLIAGAYLVTITDDNNCTFVELVAVNGIGNVTSGFTASLDQCFIGHSFDFINTGSTGDSLSWTWAFQNGNPSSSTDENPTDITWNTPGQYLITQTVIHGACNDVFSYTIEIFDEPNVTISVTDITCFGLCNGSLSATVSNGTSPYSYQWDDTNTQIIQTAIDLCAGQYNVLITDINNCTVSASAIISEPLEPLAITLEKNDVLCFGGSDGAIDLTVSGGTQPYVFSWDSGNITEDISYLPAGTYCVTVTDALNCTISDCITINEPTALTYTTSTTNVSCFEGSDGMAAVNVANGTPLYTYLWNNGDLGPSAVNISAGTYIVIVTDNNGCSFTTSMTITEPDRVVASTNADMWICIGETATLNAAATGGTPGYTFHWSGGLPDAQSVNVSPVITTQYCMHAEDSHGCISNNYCVTVNVYLPISIVVISDVDKICPGEPVTVSVVVTGGNGNYIYTLDNTTIINSPYTDYPTQSLSYTVTVSDDCGSPTDFGTVSIIVLPMPPNSFAPDITAGCQPFTVQFIESSSDIGQTYNWNFDDENSYNTSSEKNPTHIFEESGVYDITLTVTDTNGCINVDVVEDLITVYPKPVAKFEPDPEIASVIKPVIYFNNLTIGAVDYHWFFGDGDSSLAENPKHIYAPIEQTYIVELRVESDKGCKDTVFLEVRIKDEYTFYAPTAFSPDGDLINDEFFVVGHGIDERNFNLIIYDRWGEVIFEADDPNAKWNGNVQGKSSECQLGTYTWLCKFKDVTGVEHSEAGAVTIIR